MSSVLPPEPTTGPGTTGTGGKGTAPPSYDLLASESTVQVLSPTVVNDVLYCTIATKGHGVVASYPIPQGTFESVQSSAVLGYFARGIEEAMAIPYVIAGVGSQTIDAAGLLQDNVTFTVQYVPADTTGTTVTAEAVCPVKSLNGPSSTPGLPDISAAKAIIDAVYADLQRVAGG